MTKQQKFKIALPVLAVLMFFVWKPVFMGSGPKDKDKGNRTAVPVQTVGSSGISQTDLTLLLSAGQKKRARSTFQDWDRNPFILGQRQDSLVVEGILWDEQNPKVMINGNILGNGEVIDNVMVIKIKPNSVILKGKKGESEIGPGDTM